MKPTARLAASTGATHEGGKAARLTPLQELRRCVATCLLWEDTFYEDGQSIHDRIVDLCGKVPAPEVAALAVEARTRLKLRHVPLLLCRELVRRGEMQQAELALPQILQRADEPGQFLAMLWMDDAKHHVPHAVRRGISKALGRFEEYHLAKWGRGGPITMRDVLRIVHPQPKDEEQCALWRRVVKDELATPDTWEVALSTAGKDADKGQVWERLLRDGAVPAMALLRNLRNMDEAGVPKELVEAALAKGRFGRVLPFRFLAAARAVPQWESMIDTAMLRQKPAQVLPGKTVLLVDVSGSMADRLSVESDLSRLDAASGLAILAREMCGEVVIYTFSNALRGPLPDRRGMALRDAIGPAEGGTFLGEALHAVGALEKGTARVIVVTDEQAHDQVGGPFAPKGYLVNVGPYRKGVGRGAWVRIDGWSEAILDFICEEEGLDCTAPSE
jgi:60 kDa SS-A/Ro ribonucleoprotein